MGRVRVKTNRLPAIIKRLRPEMESEVDASADDLSDLIRPTLREDTGDTKRTDLPYEAGALHASVGVGFNQSTAFYARFWEWGTSRPNAFGIIVPAEAPVTKGAHAFEPMYATNMVNAVRRAVRAG